jgi:hypothetical protein
MGVLPVGHFQAIQHNFSMQYVDWTLLCNGLPNKASRQEKVLACPDRHRLFVNGFDHPFDEPDEVLIFIICANPRVYAGNLAPQLDHVHNLVVLRFRTEQTWIPDCRM